MGTAGRAARTASHDEVGCAGSSEARLAAIVRATLDAMFSLTPDLTVDSWNRGAARLLGYSADAIIGRHVSTLIPDDAGDELAETVRRLGSGDPATPIDTIRRRADGSVVEVKATTSVIRDAAGQSIGYSVSLRDLTDHRRAQNHLFAALAERERLIEADGVARELRDRVVRQLSACGMALQAACRLDPRPELSVAIEHVIDELDATISEIRVTPLESRVRRRDAIGVRAQLLQLGTEVADVLGFEPRIRFFGAADDVVPDEVAEHLVAVAREGLSNVARHAQASQVGIMVQIGREAVLEVTDDGRGLGGAARRLGLMSLEARADAVGGAFNLTSRYGAGTRLEWRAPLRPQTPMQSLGR